MGYLYALIILGTGFVLGMYVLSQIEKHIEKRITKKRDKNFLKDNIDEIQQHKKDTTKTSRTKS